MNFIVRRFSVEGFEYQREAFTSLTDASARSREFRSWGYVSFVELKGGQS